MFKKLRNKFLLLNMLITSLVMIAALSIVYLTIYNNTQTEIERKLNNVTGTFVISGTGKLPIPEPGHGVIENDHEPKETYQKVTSEYVPSFIITVDSQGKIKKSTACRRSSTMKLHRPPGTPGTAKIPQK